MEKKLEPSARKPPQMSDSFSPESSASSSLWLLVFSIHNALVSPLKKKRRSFLNPVPSSNFPPPGDLPHPGIEPMSLASLALAGAFFTASAIWEAPLPLDLSSSYCFLLEKKKKRLFLLLCSSSIPLRTCFLHLNFTH